jgi:hypothetical protein
MLRHLGRVLFIACLLTAAVAPALGASRTRTLTFTTGDFVVNCTSRGELCSPSKKLSFRLRRSGTLTSVKYTTPATHCSAVLLHVLRTGREVAKTGRLAAGVSTVRLTTHVRLPAGLTKLYFQAQGFIGGCNTGYVGSWGGKITVTVTVPRF